MTLPPSPNPLPTTEGVTQGWQVPDGWKLVPVEPTPEMLMAGDKADIKSIQQPDFASFRFASLRAEYQAMLSALPPPPGQ